LATAIEPEWLDELFPGELSTSIRTHFDSDSRRVITMQERSFRDLVIESRLGGLPDPDEAARVLAEEIVAGRLAIPAWDQAADQWLARVRTLAERCPELGFPPFDEGARREVMVRYCRGAFGHKDLKNKPLLPTLRDWLPHEQRRLLDAYVPERIDLSNGRSAKVAYEPGAIPSISLPIQSLYGIKEAIRLAKGRIPVLVNILAPSQRPVQTTQDMAGFWREHYPRIKKELQRRYPKHEWR
jgi:ATP-dependent helicase HrpB